MRVEVELWDKPQQQNIFEEPFAAICLGSQVMVASLQGNMLGSLIPANLVESLEHRRETLSERENTGTEGGNNYIWGCRVGFLSENNSHVTNNDNHLLGRRGM